MILRSAKSARLPPFRGKHSWRGSEGPVRVQHDAASFSWTTVRVIVVLAAVSLASTRQFVELVYDSRAGLPIAPVLLAAGLGVALLVSAVFRRHHVRVAALSVWDVAVAAALSTVILVALHLAPWLTGTEVSQSRLDFLALPLEAVVAIIALFGLRALPSLLSPIAFWALIWPLPLYAVEAGAGRPLTRLTSATTEHLHRLIAPRPVVSLTRMNLASPHQLSALAVTAGARQEVTVLVCYTLLALAVTGLVRGRLIARLIWIATGLISCWLASTLVAALAQSIAGPTWREALHLAQAPLVSVCVALAVGAAMFWLLPSFGLTLELAPQPSGSPLTEPAPVELRPTRQQLTRRAVGVLFAAGCLAVLGPGRVAAFSGPATETLGHTMRLLSGWLFSCYLVLVLSHTSIQILLAHRTYLGSRRAKACSIAGDAAPYPTVDVVVPCYNETPDLLQATFGALVRQDYPGVINVLVVDDASPNREQVLPVYQRFGERSGWRVLLLDRNIGKRRAQDAAFRESDGELVVTIDSDTAIAPDAIRVAAKAMDDHRVGAVSGDVGVSNWHANLLTRLIDVRYWVAFNQERAAQGVFRTILCCSGPFSIYRRSVLERVWDKYIGQTFHGVACTYGDDRHLTNLVLADGQKTVYEPRARAWTDVPTTIPGYLHQQLRWNKSFYRELLWTLPMLGQMPTYLVYDMLMQSLLPFMLVLAAASVLVHATTQGAGYLLFYGLTICAMAVVHGLYGMIRERSPRFLYLILYGFLHAGLLTAVRLRALGTLNDNRWGTRSSSGPAKPRLESVPIDQDPRWDLPVFPGATGIASWDAAPSLPTAETAPISP